MSNNRNDFSGAAILLAFGIAVALMIFASTRSHSEEVAPTPKYEVFAASVVDGKIIVDMTYMPAGPFATLAECATFVKEDKELNKFTNKMVKDFAKIFNGGEVKIFVGCRPVMPATPASPPPEPKGGI